MFSDRWRAGLTRVWRGPPFGGGEYAGTAFPVSSEAFLTAAHVAELLVGPDGRVMPDIFVTGRLFEAPTRIVDIRLPTEWNGRRPEFDFALLLKDGDKSTPAEAVVPLVGGQEHWATGESKTWFAGFEADPAMDLTVFETEYRSSYPPHRTFIFNGQFNKGMSGGAVMTDAGACGVIIGRVPDTGEIEVVPVRNLLPFLGTNGMPKPVGGSPKYPSPNMTRQEKIDWLRLFPPGPSVDQALASSELVNAFSGSLDITRATMLRLDANRLRVEVDPHRPPMSLSIYHFGEASLMGLDPYFFHLFQIAAQQGPRMFAALIVSAPPVVLDGHQQLITNIIRELYDSWRLFARR